MSDTARGDHGPMSSEEASTPEVAVALSGGPEGASDRARCKIVNGKSGLRELEADLRRSRSYPIVVLTRDENSRDPVIIPGDIRSVIGAAGEIYFIPREYLLRRLNGMLRRNLAVPRGAARVFWPGLTAQSDPEAHPLVAGLMDEAPWATLAAFTRAFDLSRPHVRAEIIQLEDSRRMQERQRIAAEEQQASTEQHLRDAQYELHRVRTAAERSHANVRPPATEMDSEEVLHVLITRAWLSELTATERRKHGLGRYVLMPRFVEQLETQNESVRERIAWVCAMFATAYPDAAIYADEQAELEPQPTGANDNTQGTLYVHDVPPEVAHLIYLVRADLTVEFAELSSGQDTL